MQAGNALFQRGDHVRAAEEYTAGLAAAQPDQAPLKAVLHCNHAAAMHTLGQHVAAIADCCAAITLDPSYLKAYQRRAEAATALGDMSSAVQVCLHGFWAERATVWLCFRLHPQGSASHVVRVPCDSSGAESPEGCNSAV